MDPEDGMGWSWPELEATPEHVRQYCLDFLHMKRSAQADAAQRAARGRRHVG